MRVSTVEAFDMLAEAMYRAKEEEAKVKEEEEEQQATLATMRLRVTSPRSLLSAAINIDSPLLAHPEWSSIYAIRFWDALNASFAQQL